MGNLKSSRREFLKTSSHAAMVGASASAYQNILGANERVRVGFIGVGLIGKRHLLDFMAQPDVEVAAICEVYEPRLDEGVSTSGGKAARFKDFRKMLDRRDLDAVVVSTPDHWHALMTMMACAAGKDVYVEKPMTHVVREGRWMVEVAGYHKRVVQVGTQQRSGEHYRKCMELIRKGHLGEVRNTRITAFRNIMPGFTSAVGTESLSGEDWNLWLGPAPYVPFDKHRCIYHFRWFWDYSGGQTTNLLSHDLDIVQWATGQLPRSVSAMGGRFSLKGIGETPDVFEAIFAYPGFVTNWSSREIGARSPGTTDSLEFCGTLGTLVINRSGFEVFPDKLIPADHQIPQFTGPRRKAETDTKYRTTALREEGFQELKDQFRPHVRNFLDCVKSRKQPVSDLESGHRTITSCHLANLSMKLSRTLHWDAEKELILGDAETNQLLTKEYRSPWDRELKSVLPAKSS